MYRFLQPCIFKFSLSLQNFVTNSTGTEVNLYTSSGRNAPKEFQTAFQKGDSFLLSRLPNIAAV